MPPPVSARKLLAHVIWQPSNSSLIFENSQRVAVLTVGNNPLVRFYGAIGVSADVTQTSDHVAVWPIADMAFCTANVG